MKVLLFTLFGFESGIERIRKKLEELDLNVEFQIGSQLDENEKIFSTNSRYFEDEDKKKDAKAIISYYGEKIESKTPLGYLDFQLGVVFPDNCPNNSLPILRGSIRSANFNWDPIFYRRSSY